MAEIIESWKLIEESTGYFISNLGRIKNPRGMIMNPQAKSPKGYVSCKIAMNKVLMEGESKYNKYKNMLIHRLVAIAFIPRIENKPMVNHINGIRDDNRACNLEWVDASENRRARVFDNPPNTDRKIVQIDSITGELIKIWDKIFLADSFYKANTGQCARGKTKLAGGYKWKYLDEYQPVVEDELWKQIEGFPHEVSTHGRVRNGQRIPKLSKDGNYLTYTKNLKVHIAVAKTFIENPNNYPVVNHKDGNPLNNNVKNLEWTTQQENVKHAIANNLHNPNNNGSKRAVRQYLPDGTWKDWESALSAERELKISSANISTVCNGRQATCGGFKWKFLDQIEVDDLCKGMKYVHVSAIVRNNTRPIREFQPDGLEVDYENYKDASEKTGLTVANIRGACTGRRQTAGCSKWKFIDEITE